MTNEDNIFRLPEVHLTAAEFWDVYFSGNLRLLQRDPRTGYTGERSVYTRGQFLPKEQPFTIALAELRQHAYAEDVRFLSGPQATLGQCLATVLRMPAMQLTTVPNQHQLELARRLSGIEPEEPLDYSKLRAMLIAHFERAAVPLEQVLELMAQTQPGLQEHQRYEETGQISALRAERALLVKALALTGTDPRVTEALAGVVESAYEDSEVVAAAIWAIGRHNDKAVIPRLLLWLSQKRLAFHSLSIEQALQFLCSGERLIPLAAEDEPRYWKDMLASLPKRPGEWLEWDASSVFWQKRLRCALFAQAPALQERLRADEVLPVRLAAGALQR